MTILTKGGTCHPGINYPLRRVLVAVCLLIALAACEQKVAGEPAHGTADGPAALQTGSGQEIAGRLIRRLVSDPDGAHVAVEINDEMLRDLVAREGRGEFPGQFRDPLLAARLFAPHIGLSENAEFSITQRSLQVEEASGLFIAVVRVKQGEEAVDMRMISEPDSLDQPTLWVLNDYRR